MHPNYCTMKLLYLGNRSEQNTCTYIIFCLEWPMLWSPRILIFPPGTPCMYLVIGYRYKEPWVQVGVTDSKSRRLRTVRVFRIAYSCTKITQQFNLFQDLAPWPPWTSCFSNHDLPFYAMKYFIEFFGAQSCCGRQTLAGVPVDRDHKKNHPLPLHGFHMLLQYVEKANLLQETQTFRSQLSLVLTKSTVNSGL
jgi:hypothetical protein